MINVNRLIKGRRRNNVKPIVVKTISETLNAETLMKIRRWNRVEVGCFYFEDGDKNHDEKDEFVRVNFTETPSVVDDFFVQTIRTEIEFIENILPSLWFTLQNLLRKGAIRIFGIFYKTNHP